MKNFVKILALVLSLLMLMSVFAGCGKENEKAKEPLGANLTKEEKFAEPVTLTWCFPDARGAADFSEWDRIVAAINEITQREINTTINIEVIPLGEYTEKMSLKYAANERWDIAFSDKGPVMVEGNEFPGHDLFQLPGHNPQKTGIMDRMEV